MNKALENLINGNLTDAKRLAKRLELFKLAQFARDNYGWERNHAIMAAAYLKGRATFQAYCDAELEARTN